MQKSIMVLVMNIKVINQNNNYNIDKRYYNLKNRKHNITYYDGR